MPRKRTKTAVSHETATKVAEGVGEALARAVNRLESLDAERARAYAQLLALQERLNVQVARLGRAIGRTMTSASPGRAGGRGRPRVKTPGVAAKRPATGRKPPTCSICGKPGHNAQGHAKWKASKSG